MPHILWLLLLFTWVTWIHAPPKGPLLTIAAEIKLATKKWTASSVRSPFQQISEWKAQVQFSTKSTSCIGKELSEKKVLHFVLKSHPSRDKLSASRWQCPFSCRFWMLHRRIFSASLQSAKRHKASRLISGKSTWLGSLHAEKAYNV